MTETDDSERDRFRETTYNGEEITERHLTRQEVLRLDPDDVDFHWDKAFGRARAREPDGKRIEHSGTLPGVGWITEHLLMAMMRRPGQSLTPLHLMAITRLATFEKNNRISQRMTKVRQAFGESAGSDWFFKGTRDPFTVGWNIDRTWRIIETVITPEKEDGRKK